MKLVHRLFGVTVLLLAGGCGNKGTLLQLDLPSAVHAQRLEAPEVGPYPLLTVRADGTVFVDRVECTGPLKGDSILLKAVFVRAHAMPTVERVEGYPGSGEVPGNPVLLRADRAAPYGVVRQVMSACNHFDVQIWRLRIAASGVESEGALEVEMMRDIAPHCLDSESPIGNNWVTLDCSSGVAVHISRRWSVSKGDKDIALRFRTANPAELTNYLALYAAKDSGARWELYAPEDARWEDVVLAVDAFVAAGLKVLVPMNAEEPLAIEPRPR